MRKLRLALMALLSVVVMILGATAALALPATNGMTLGVYTPQNFSGWSGIDSWQAGGGLKPNVVNYYSGWGQGFNTTFANTAKANGAEPFVEMEPWNDGAVTASACSNTSGVPKMTDITAGKYDAYLKSFATSVKAYGGTVLLTFAHEMNGNWYPWGNGGCEGTTPAQWVAAWKHVVTTVKAIAPNGQWVWVPNDEQGAGPVAPYWPGTAYESTVGLDAYLWQDSDTYGATIAPTVADIAKLTTQKVWIAETGIGNPTDSSGPTRIANYVTAIKAAGLKGMLYFDQGQFVLNNADLAAMSKAWNA